MTVLRPPSPGMRARLLRSGKVEISYSFYKLPTRCRPVRLQVTLDLHDDTLAGQPYLIRIQGLKGTRQLGLPRDLRHVDVAIAQAFTDKGMSSRDVSVLITS